MKTYVIVPFNEISAEMISNSNSHNLSGVRFNNDKTKALLAFDMRDHAPFLGRAWFTESEIKNEMKQAEWIEAVGFFQSVANFFTGA